MYLERFLLLIEYRLKEICFRLKEDNFLTILISLIVVVIKPVFFLFF